MHDTPTNNEMPRPDQSTTTNVAPLGQLRYLILAAQREGDRILAQQLAPFEVSPSQAEILVVLDRFGPLTLKGLGSLIVCETGSPSRLVDVLVKRGLVIRAENPADRREVLLEVSLLGQEITPKLMAIENELDSMLAQAFPAQHQAMLTAGLRSFLAGSRSGEAIDNRFPVHPL